MKCFEYYAKCGKKCQKKSCRYWINSVSDQNCTVNSAGKGQKTLQDIGKIYSITRMRVCQIEKTILAKIKKRVNLLSF
jgi:DNA-directed RNA polymerase sigma subunit (sigma70/sigma32)